MIRKILEYRISIGQLVAIGLLLGIPYGIVGLIWALSTTDHLGGLDGVDQFFSFLGEIVAWPVLVISDVYLQ